MVRIQCSNMFWKGNCSSFPMVYLCLRLDEGKGVTIGLKMRNTGPDGKYTAIWASGKTEESGCKKNCDLEALEWSEFNVQI